MLQEYHERLLAEKEAAIAAGDHIRLAEIEKSLEALNEF
jgi:hypothetical protein